MKKALAAVLAAVLLVPAIAFAADDKVIKVGVTPFPHKDIMEAARPLLEKEGYELKIVEFTDYVTPNTALAEGAIDANFFQHVPYFDNANKERGLKCVWVAKIHIEPMGLYSSKVKSVDEIEEGAQIAIPNDATNCARALRVLEKAGLIKVKEGELITAKDITDNPKKLKISEIDAAQLPRTLQDVTAAVINTNFAGEAGLNPAKDAIVIEDKDSPYANIIVVREADKDSDKTKALVKATQSRSRQGQRQDQGPRKSDPVVRSQGLHREGPRPQRHSPRVLNEPRETKARLEVRKSAPNRGAFFIVRRNAAASPALLLYTPRRAAS